MGQVEGAKATAVDALSITLDQDLPVGAGFRAIRSPRSDRDGPATSLTFANQDSVGSDLGAGKSRLSPTGSSDSLELNPNPQDPGRSSQHQPHAKDDLAKRAQTRVTERKRTELEKKQEQEKLRMKKQESDKIKKDHDEQLRQRRRAEIYALNAILRQLQQEKMAAFVNAHKHHTTTREEVEHQHTETSVLECSEPSLVQSIGV